MVPRGKKIGAVFCQIAGRILYLRSSLKDGPFVWGLGHQIFHLAYGFDSPGLHQIRSNPPIFRLIAFWFNDKVAIALEKRSDRRVKLGRLKPIPGHQSDTMVLQPSYRVGDLPPGTSRGNFGTENWR